MTKFEKVFKGLEVCIEYNDELWCGEDCPYQTTGKDCSYELMKDALELLKEQQWVSVKDRLPERTLRPNRFLVSCRDPRFHTTVVDSMRFSNGVWYYDGAPIEREVTHWMPLPEPPKEGDGE